MERGPLARSEVGASDLDPILRSHALSPSTLSSRRTTTGADERDKQEVDGERVALVSVLRSAISLHIHIQRLRCHISIRYQSRVSAVSGWFGWSHGQWSQPASHPPTGMSRIRRAGLSGVQTRRAVYALLGKSVTPVGFHRWSFRFYKYAGE